jgi:hypothetical protein
MSCTSGNCDGCGKVIHTNEYHQKSVGECAEHKMELGYDLWSPHPLAFNIFVCKKCFPKFKQWVKTL